MPNVRWFPDAWHGAKVLWEHRFADRRHDSTFKDTTNATEHRARIFTVTRGTTQPDTPYPHTSE